MGLFKMSENYNDIPEQENPFSEVNHQPNPIANPEEAYINPPSMRTDDQEIGLIKELSPKKVLEQLRMNLKGFFYDYEKKAYLKVPGFEPLMNDRGISKYLSIMSSVICDLVTFSNYKDEEINSLTLYVCSRAIPTIHINYQEYGIQDKSDLPIIDIQIFNLTLAAFKKAVGAGDRNVVRGGYQEKFGRGFTYGGGMGGMYGDDMMMQRQPKKGFLGRINPFS
jgi:hypothetical protein